MDKRDLTDKTELKLYLTELIGLQLATSISYHTSNGTPRGANITVQASSLGKDARYAIKTVPDWQSLIIWDLDYRRRIGATADSLLVSTESVLKLKPGRKALGAVYRKLDTGLWHFDKWEKVAVLGIDNVDGFFRALNVAMKPNEYDEHYQPKERRKYIDSPIVEGDDGDLKQRRESITRFARESTFPRRVLERYGMRCAICRLDIPEALNAAHRHGHTVEEGAFFKTEDGICLCANHHAMYDRNLFNINFETGRAWSDNDCVMRDASWRHFLHKYDSQILQP